MEIRNVIQKYQDIHSHFMMGFVIYPDKDHFNLPLSYNFFTFACK
jgi:hypothetical protein